MTTCRGITQALTKLGKLLHSKTLVLIFPDLVKLPLKRGGLNLKFFKISFVWLRISILSIIVMVAAVLVSRQPGVEKLVKKIMTPALTSVEKEWSLELDKAFILCGHNEIEKSSYSSLKDLQAIVDNNDGYLLKRISGHLQVYGMSISDYCTNCRNHQFLGVSEQNVVVFRGTPDKPGPILEKTTIQIKDLPQLELEDLQKGISFGTINEKLQLIEGLKGLNAN